MGKIRMILDIVLLLLVVWLGVRWVEWRNLYHPSSIIEFTPADVGLSYEDVYFVAEDSVALTGWWIPCEQARGTVIICHGNGGNIGNRISLADDLHRLGVNVFLFDYRGYGNSRGWPRERGLYRDARAAYEVVRARYNDSDVPPILVYGESLGGAVALQLALEKPVKGLIMQSTFTSTRDMAWVIYPHIPLAYLIPDSFNSLRKITKLKVPLLIAHSREDDLVPFQMGSQLFDASPQPKEFIELRGGHNESGWTIGDNYWRALERFIWKNLGAKENSG